MRVPAIACILLANFTASANDNSQYIEDTDTVTDSKDLQEVIVRGVRDRGRDKFGHMSVSGVEINKRPALLGEHDVIKALQTSSGVVAGTEGFAGLYVRGGETDQNLYLLGGLPLLNVYHFGGLFSTFSTHSIDRVDFYKGAFPALFSERASSIVDVGLKTPDYTNTKGVFSIGLISGQLYLTTPIKKGNSALSVSLRRTWLDVFSAPALAIMNATKKRDGTKTIFNYNFTDLSVKFSATDHRRNDFSMMFFFGKDNFKLGDEHFDPKDKKDINEKDINRMSWGNWGFSADYRLYTPIGDLTLQPYVSKAFSSDVEENIRKEGDDVDLTSTTSVKPSVFQTGMREYLSFPIAHGLEGEAGLQQTWYDYNVGNPTARYTDTGSSEMKIPFTNHSKNWLLSAFGEILWNAADIFKGSVGLRGNRYMSQGTDHWNLEPRLSIKVGLPYESSISIGMSRVTQYAQQVTSNYMYLPSDAWLPTASHHKPLVCDIYSVGYFKKFKKDYSVKAEVWWKNMRNLAEYKPNTSVTTSTLSWFDKLTYGKGWAYGLDLEFDGRYGKVNWNVAYGLMWNWRKFPGINEGRRYPAKFDNRHKLDINLGWQINERMELTGQWEYMTGNRTTVALYNIAPPDIAFPDSPFVNPMDINGKRQDGIDYFENRNNVRIQAFHRLNLNLSVKGRLGKWLTYQWDFGLYNAYCRMNPFTIKKDYINDKWSDKGDYREFKTLSLLPILPSVSYTINF